MQNFIHKGPLFSTGLAKYISLAYRIPIAKRNYIENFITIVPLSSS